MILFNDWLPFLLFPLSSSKTESNYMLTWSRYSISGYITFYFFSCSSNFCFFLSYLRVHCCQDPADRAHLERKVLVVRHSIKKKKTHENETTAKPSLYDRAHFHVGEPTGLYMPENNSGLLPHICDKVSWVILT